MKETNEWYQIELDTTKYTPVCAFTFHVPGGMTRSHDTSTYVEYAADPEDPEKTIYSVWFTNYWNNIRIFKYKETISWPAHDQMIMEKILQQINNSITFLKYLDIFMGEEFGENIKQVYEINASGYPEAFAM